MQPTSMSFEESGHASSAFSCGSSADLEAPAPQTADHTPSPVPERSADEYLPLIEALAPAVHRFVARRIANKEDSEDIAQQSLLQAFTGLSTFRGQNLRAWLLTISRHLIIDHYRARNRVQFLEVTETALRETEPSLRTRHDAIHALCDCRARLGHWVDCITRRLRLEEQVAVLLADVHGYSDKASAAELTMTLPSFKLLLHGARARLNAVAGGSCALLSKPKEGASDSICSTAVTNADSATNSNCATCRVGQIRPKSVNGIVSKQASSAGPPGRSEPPQIGVAACISIKCRFGINCRLGIKCCRNVPKLIALRARLLEALSFS